MLLTFLSEVAPTNVNILFTNGRINQSLVLLVFRIGFIK